MCLERPLSSPAISMLPVATRITIPSAAAIPPAPPFILTHITRLCAVSRLNPLVLAVHAILQTRRGRWREARLR